MRGDRVTVDAPAPEKSLPAQSVCPTCTAVSGDTSPRVRDPKGVHKCQVCRSELTHKYADALPGIKSEKLAKLKEAASLRR